MREMLNPLPIFGLTMMMVVYSTLVVKEVQSQGAVTCTSPQSATVQTSSNSDDAKFIYSSADWKPATNAQIALTPSQINHDCSWEVQCPEDREFVLHAVYQLFPPEESSGTAAPHSQQQFVAAAPSWITRRDHVSPGDHTNVENADPIYFERTGNTSNERRMVYSTQQWCRSASEAVKPFTTLHWQYSTNFKEEGFKLEYSCQRVAKSCNDVDGGGATQDESSQTLDPSIVAVIVIICVLMVAALAATATFCYCKKLRAGRRQAKEQLQGQERGGGSSSSSSSGAPRRLQPSMNKPPAGNFDAEIL